MIKKKNSKTASSDASQKPTYQFGGYDWLALDVKDDKVLLLSKKIMGEGPYHYGDAKHNTWENSTIRASLNGEFLDSFSESDRARIAETLVINSDNLEHGTDCGADTKDCIFLLSIDEAKRYFGSDKERVAYYYDEDEENECEHAWWLRSLGLSSCYAASVHSGGRIISGGYDVSGGRNGVRPALWVKLQSAMNQ